MLMRAAMSPVDVVKQGAEQHGLQQDVCMSRTHVRAAVYLTDKLNISSGEPFLKMSELNKGCGVVQGRC